MAEGLRAKCRLLGLLDIVGERIEDIRRLINKRGRRKDEPGKQRSRAKSSGQATTTFYTVTPSSFFHSFLLCNVDSFCVLEVYIDTSLYYYPFALTMHVLYAVHSLVL